MKKSLQKFWNNSLNKLKQHKEQIKKFSFSAHQEDFVITEQEEKEGGFFGSMSFSNKLGFKVH
ncbi:MAG: hypothetical protein SGI83_00555 [Bacteroidota bacterium]|nr:hypothetical protein [Bacteroidota bacterium]